MMELDAIAAAVIGGTSLLGGQGTVWGALLGALVMASLDNGMSLLNTESFWQPIIKGAHPGGRGGGGHGRPPHPRRSSPHYGCARSSTSKAHPARAVSSMR